MSVEYPDIALIILMAMQKCLPKVHDYMFMCKIAVKIIIAERKQAFILKCI